MKREIDKKTLHELFVKIKEGNKEAFNEIYEKYYKLVYGICFSILKNKENSEDVAQTVFAKLLKMPKEKLPDSSETTWLYTVTKNEALQFLRTKNEDIDINSVYDYYVSDEELEQVAKMEEYYKIIKNLNEKQKEIVSLKVLDDFTFKEIGQMLNMPTATVQWYYYKSINILKSAVSSMAAFILAILVGTQTFKNKFNFSSMDSENLTQDKFEDNIDIEEDMESVLPDELNNSISNTNKEENITDNITGTIDLQENRAEINNNIYLGISGVLLIISIIFAIFFKKSQQKLRKKSSK